MNTKSNASYTGNWSGGSVDESYKALVEDSEAIPQLDARIRPPSSLIDLDAVHEWLELLQQHGKMDLFDGLFKPSQLTVQGVRGAWVPSSYVLMTNEDILRASYDNRHKNEVALKELRRLFYTDPSFVEARLSYTPVRLLGWWNKNLSDEIDWLKTISAPVADPYLKPENASITSTPPTYYNCELTTDGVNKVCREICVLQGRPVSDAGYLASMVWSDVQAREARHNGHVSETKHRWIVRRALKKITLSHKSVGYVLGIDLETSGLSALRDWCLNAGWLWTDLHDSTEKIVGETVRYYGVPETRAKLGNPTENISGITTGELEGLSILEADDDAQKQLLSALTSAPYMAHNAPFEDHWFEQCVNGYSEAKRDGMVKIIDSRKISQRLDYYKGKEDNKLQSYARRWGALAPDEMERHLGINDSLIMVQAAGRNLRALGMA